MANYLYNGVELPALPEWDKETYPYAIILHIVYDGLDRIQFFASPNPFMAYPNEENSLSYTTEAVPYYLQAEINCLIGETEWGEVERQPAGAVTGWYFVPRRLPFWADHDVYTYERVGYDDDGFPIHQATDELYLAASEPVPVGGETQKFDLKSWLTGFVAGVAGKPLPIVQREPVAYLYNGTQLPALPEWDRKTYPYAYLIVQGANMGYLYMFLEPKHLTFDNVGTMCTAVRVGETYLRSHSIGGKDFGDPEEITATSEQPLHFNMAWANYNILNEDGTLYLSASDPVPVYESEVNPDG